MAWERSGAAAVEVKNDWRCSADCKLKVSQSCVMWLLKKKKRARKNCNIKKGDEQSGNLVIEEKGKDLKMEK